MVFVVVFKGLLTRWLSTGWDVECEGLTAARKREDEWKETTSRWETAPMSRSSGDWGPVEEGSRSAASDAQAFLTLYYMSRGHGRTQSGRSILFPCPWMLTP
jgi:hypothetical protein